MQPDHCGEAGGKDLGRLPGLIYTAVCDTLVLLACVCVCVCVCVCEYRCQDMYINIYPRQPGTRAGNTHWQSA